MTCAHCLTVPTPSEQHIYCSDRCRREADNEAQRNAYMAIERGPVRTLREVADALGLSKSRVDQIERSALRKLRMAMNREDYL